MVNSRRWAIVELTACGICRRPVQLVEGIDSAALFDPGPGAVPHRCTDAELIRYRAVRRLAGRPVPTEETREETRLAGGSEL